MGCLCYNLTLWAFCLTCGKVDFMSELRSTEHSVSTAEVLAEVERRQAEARHPVGRSASRIVFLADRFVFWFSKHWLAVFNALAGLYVGLPVLAPVLLYLGAERPAMVIHAVYGPLCHQLPHRSWFLFGPQFAYTMPELVQLLGGDVIFSPWSGDFVGNEVVGYKMAFCQRDVAIYGAIFVAGLVYGLLRRRWNVKPLPWWAYAGFGILPMLLDGGYQLLSYVLFTFWPDGPIAPYESTPLMRAVTGGLFGLATVWMAYPYVQETMQEFKETLHQRFGWE
ncbi:MAG: hypothetical protein DRI48_07615 [Chloroflexi bacterium]|nr:MAG: hypothetical protein DRI48_07615 [Chloroflexota bacterium]